MASRLRPLGLGALILLAAPLAAWAQYPSALVGFNGGLIDDPTAMEMFRTPQTSGTTTDFIVPNSTGQYNWNYAARFAGLQTEGAAALQVMWHWVDPNDADAWLRLTTSEGAERPNPALHTEGKVRFKVNNLSGLFQGEVGICLGIRETDVVTPQLYNGGAGGTIEWVGVNVSVVTAIKGGGNGVIDSTLGGDDVILNLSADPNAPAEVISWGADRVFASTLDPNSDDVAISGVYYSLAGKPAPIPAISLPPSPVAYVLEWDLTDGSVTLDGVPSGGGIAAFTGDGDLSTPHSRGTLECVAFSNVVSNTNAQIILAIDELQFEAPEPDPVLPPRVLSPILPNDVQVTVTDLQFGVEQVTLLKNHSPLETKNVASNDDVVFSIAAAQAGELYSATQTIGAITSAESEAVPVTYSAHYPVIYMAPAEGATTVRVMDVLPEADLVEIIVNDTTSFTTPIGTETFADVPVTGLVMGDSLVAYYWVGVAPSAAAPAEIVTTNTTAVILACEDFESYATQTDLNAVWTQAKPANPITLVTDQNATCPTGTKSSFLKDAPGQTGGYMYHTIPQTTPTFTHPVVVTVNIYDPIGIDPNNATQNWVELNHTGGPDYFFIHVGMAGVWGVDPGNEGLWYDFRAVGNGGPSWVQLNQYDAPQRSIGWHSFTVVHKAHLIDVYVDGLLAAKNVTLSSAPADVVTYARAEIGGGWSDETHVGIWADDFCVEVGPGHHGCIAPAVCRGDANCDDRIDFGDITAFVNAIVGGTYCDGTGANADVNGNGSVGFDDITPFVNLLTQNPLPILCP